ncbi:hypothetical protein HYH03_003708 [Edaphochlamys debaryana]|uniref:Uncharacterized protein n=1 Tax=Edaphochlamys debaryana TaxID=47281 RepID=A0A835Y9C8_9CHLO|nr:hypothetical protein HYH03_003708 [Edaphochlamys debaryana]|eukprot:KAG2498453.1 hypothetical protein HYH03_003708 [Edaphochlamys debaryana]
MSQAQPFEAALKAATERINLDLASNATRLLRLIGAVDLCPDGGLCTGHYATQAIRRYWLLWLPLLHSQQATGAPTASLLLPPLDVQFAWYVHRLNPRQALGFSARGPADPEGRGAATREAWEALYPSGPGQPPEHAFWPPAAPDPATAASGHAAVAPCAAAPAPADGAAAPAAAGSLERVQGYVLQAMARQGTFLHHVLRAPYTDPGFLASARTRYLRFLALILSAPPGSAYSVPMYDIDLMWHAHQAMSGVYGADCSALGVAGGLLGHDDALPETTLAADFGECRLRYESLTRLMYNVAPTRKVPHSVAHPLAAPLWPLAAALAGPRDPLLPPREVAAELACAAADLKRSERARSLAASRSGREARSPSLLPGRLSRALGCLGRAGGGHPHDLGDGDGDMPPSQRAHTARRRREAPKRPHMLGSLDHVGRCGVFALYALWRLGQARTDGRAGAAGTGGHSEGSPDKPGASGGALSRCFGGRAQEAPVTPEVETAARVLSDALLGLSGPHAWAPDLDSPLASSEHPFWQALFPLPSSLAAPPPAVPTQHRLPAPAPVMDLPAGFAPGAARDEETVYLAAHHYAEPRPVLYTPSDYCLLGPPFWCLKPTMAAANKPAQALPESTKPGAGTSGAPARPSGGSSSASSSASGDGTEGRGPDAAGLGALVHGPQWGAVVLEAYRRVHAALEARRGGGARGS